MEVRELAVSGAYAFSPEVYADPRGTFCSPLQGDILARSLGHPLFPVAQASISRSRRGVVRGVHYTALPGSMAKYVQCVGGRALDVVVDIRVGSPTFGRTESVVLCPGDGTALYLPVGVGHLFVALEDDTVMSYLLSAGYAPEKERALHPLGGDLTLDLPAGLELLLSDRDRAAPTLAQAAAEGLLPEHADCVAAQRALFHSTSTTSR